MKSLGVIIGFLLLFQMTNSYCQVNDSRIIAKYYSFIVPDNWRLITDFEAKKEIDRMKNENGIVIPPFDYALQLASSPTLFQRPFIIIRQNNDGKISQMDIKGLTNLDSKTIVQLKESINTQSHGNVQVSDLKKQYYDKERHIIYSIFGSKVETIGNTIQIQAWLLTNNGYIQVIGSYLANDFSLMYDDFIKFVNIFKLKNGYAS